MNAPTLLKPLLSLALLGACVAPWNAQASLEKLQPLSLTAADVDAESTVVTGRIVAKSDNRVTVNGDSIEITASTAIIKETGAITFDEVKTGDDVRIATVKGADGSIRALSLEVLNNPTK